MYTTPNIQNSIFFFFEKFDLLRIFLKLLFSTCLHFSTGLNLYKDIFGKVDLFAPLLGDIEAIILCSFDFDLKKKREKKSAPPPAPSQKKLWRTTNNYFFRPIKLTTSVTFTSNGSLIFNYILEILRKLGYSI